MLVVTEVTTNQTCQRCGRLSPTVNKGELTIQTSPALPTFGLQRVTDFLTIDRGGRPYL
ncbi:hypothetical protein ACNKHU_02780 [Shigella flexneri]